jgi:pimeloyl-ACP methyl ester carboxylesterase
MFLASNPLLTLAAVSAATIATAMPLSSSRPRVEHPEVRHRHLDVMGRSIFFRDAGDPKAPAIVLLHGFPTSSRMYRELIPALADTFHVVAPDYVGFGYSDAPAADQFPYTFETLTAHVTGLLDQLGLRSYVLYMQDYGGPVGFRIQAARPHQVAGLVVQNANAYIEGVGEAPRQVFLPLWEKRDEKSEAGARSLLQPDMTKFQYVYGARNPEAIDPDNWTVDQALLDRPGVATYQIDLLENYKTNVASYDAWHASFRAHRPKTLIVWGKNDPIFIPAGAEAFKRDLPDAKLVWLDGGHFALEENVPLVASEIKAMFAGK